jgi:hypothetical protein
VCRRSVEPLLLDLASNLVLRIYSNACRIRMNCDASPPPPPPPPPDEAVASSIPVAAALVEVAVVDDDDDDDDADDDESGWYFNANSLNLFWIVSNEDDGDTPRTLNGFLGTLDNIRLRLRPSLVHRSWIVACLCCRTIHSQLSQSAWLTVTVFCL